MKYDTEKVEPTDRFIEAVQELMRAEMEMMRLHEPEMADCWTWGVCILGDIATRKGLNFEYGGDEDKPDYMPENMDVMVKGL
jgi:hypothetical protein